MKNNTARTLGAVSAQFVEQVKKQGMVFFSVKEASRLLQKDYYGTSAFLSKLTKRGVLQRVKAGHFFVCDMGEENTQLNNWSIIARELALPQSYFVGYGSAMRFHGMTTHAFYDVCIVQSHRKKTKKIGNFNYQFIFSKEDHFWGYESFWVTAHEQVLFSDMERTILDCLARPMLCGGFMEIVRGMWQKKNNINYERLMRYAKRYKHKAAVKRLCFIVELLNMGRDILEGLGVYLTDASDYVLLDPDGQKTGKYLKRWHVRVNVAVDEIKQEVWA